MAKNKIPKDIVEIMNEAASISWHYSNASNSEYKNFDKATAAFDKKYGKGAFDLYFDLYWHQKDYETKYKDKIAALKKPEEKTR